MRRPVQRSLIAIFASLALLLAGASAANAHGHGPDKNGDQPLPGYTISNPTLDPLSVGGEQTTVLQGVRSHAAYDIEIPPNWNGDLVLWAHGYRGPGKTLTVDTPSYGLRQTFAQQGYAWAASSYARNAYDVGTGVTTTHDLARYAAKKLPKKPKRTYIAGVSMGGHVIARSLEQYPKFYDGAMPMCGVVGGQKLFDFFLDYNLVAQTLAGVDAYPYTADYQTTQVPQIRKALGLDTLAPGGPDTTNALGKQLRAVTVNESGGPRPGTDGAFAYWKDFLFTLPTPDNGGPLAENAGRLAQNIFQRYEPNTPVNLNREVPRVAPTDIRSRLTPRLTDIPNVYGSPRVPVLSLHGLGDLFVPFSMEQVYAKKVARHGQSDLLVQRALRAVEHCAYTPTEVGTAWNDLTTWVEAKGHKARDAARPEGDDVTDATTVADPAYGCRFTDPSAQAVGTRALYPACP